jgi:hypothetical protein
MPPNQFGAQNPFIPPTTTGSIKRGNPIASRPLQGISAGTSRNWGPNNNPNESGGISKAIGDTLAFNMRYGRNPFGGRRTSRAGGGGGGSAGGPSGEGNGTGGLTINFGDGPTFGSQQYLGSTVEGNPSFNSNPAPGVNPTGGNGRSTSGAQFGDQSYLGATVGGAGAVAGGGEFSQPQTRTRKQLTPEQKQRNSETAKARRALASDIKKNGTAEQQQRVQEEGVAGGKTRQPRSKTAAAPASRITDARTIQANQSDASSRTAGAGPAPTGAGESFIGIGSVQGASVKFTDGGLDVQGGKIGKNELAS